MVDIVKRTEMTNAVKSHLKRLRAARGEPPGFSGDLFT